MKVEPSQVFAGSQQVITEESVNAFRLHIRPVHFTRFLQIVVWRPGRSAFAMELPQSARSTFIKHQYADNTVQYGKSASA